MDKIELGSHVKTIISNKGFDIAFDTLREQYKDAWASTSIGQSELRETLYNTSVALEDIQRQFKALAVAGDNAIFIKESENK